jgi:hypothetical protein
MKITVVYNGKNKEKEEICCTFIDFLLFKYEIVELIFCWLPSE